MITYFFQNNSSQTDEKGDPFSSLCKTRDCFGTIIAYRKHMQCLAIRITSMATVRVKFGNRVLRLRPQSLTTRNLGLIFKLDINRGIYLNCEEEGEIILENDGLFEIENFEKTYVVNGDCATTALPPQHHSQSVQIGVPLSYQPATQRSVLNPPPCGRVDVANIAQRSLERPRFTTPSATKPKKIGWKKAFTLIDVDRMGDITEKYQIHLQLNEDSASVNGIEELLKRQLGYSVSLLDAKYLPVMPGETTKGSQFWKSNRKIAVVNVTQKNNIKLRRSGSKKKKPHEIVEQLKRLIADTPDDEDDDPDDPDSPLSMVPTPNPLHLPESHNSINERAVKLVSSIFKCAICLNIATLPAAACSTCYSVIGCIPCIEQWYESSDSNRTKCPLCRTTKEYHIIPLLREVALLLKQPIPNLQESHTSQSHSQTSVLSDTESLDTIPYGENDAMTRDDELDDEFPVMLD